MALNYAPDFIVLSFVVGFMWIIYPVTPVQSYPDSKVHGANKGPTWVLSAPCGPHVSPMNLGYQDLVVPVPLA